MQHMQYEFHLFGPRRGKTAMINGHKFVNGVCVKVLSPVQVAPLMRVLSYYGAFARGTPEYDAALAKEDGNGANEVHQGPGSGAPAEVQDGVQPDGTGSSALPADDGDGAKPGPAPSAGDDSAGDGHEDAGLPKFAEPATWIEPHEPASVGSQEVKAALIKLDPHDDSHWVRTGGQAGKPKLSAVEHVYGKAGLTRADLEAAYPGFNRQVAAELKLVD